MSAETDENLAAEAHAFDRQIEERIANGHIPDLQRCVPCDWFYNNPWRHPKYVQLDFGEQHELIRDAIRAHAPVSKGRSRVLEVGCGPGYMSLELARSGFDVTGVDLSSKCIEVARQFAAEDPDKQTRGPLRYLATDFIAGTELQVGSFDAVVFLGALHHFPDQERILGRVSELLKPGGIAVVHEPVRDRVTKGNAVLVHLLRVLLSAQGGFYKQYPIPADAGAAAAQFEQLYTEMRYETEAGENVQSVNDNEAGYEQMYPVLRAKFAELQFSWRYAFFHELIGGLRFKDEVNFALARYLRDIDAELCRQGVLSATEFFFVGRKGQDAVHG